MYLLTSSNQILHSDHSEGNFLQDLLCPRPSG